MEKEKIQTTNELILTAGPYIDYREVNYAADAAQNGWNKHHSDYLNKLEMTFAEYIGVKQAKATSSCTGALHLALLAMGIGSGDEVILPETTWIATAAAVVYVGAKPVFADIEADTWVLDPKSVEKLITKKTKAIIPVHLYGQPVDMDPILELAKKYKIRILEDAAPSIGTIYKGKKTGSFGDMAAFSFQGAKAVVTGEGGMLVSNNDDLLDKAWFYNDHGRDPEKTLYNIAIGYKYKMSNIQAAIGLAQMEKVEEIVAKKRQIFKWYEERLNDVKEIALNVEKKETRNIFWMSSIVLGDAVKFSRDEFIAKLKERKVDSRPMFYPISSFKMFESQEKINPVAYKIPVRGINLPSGHERTEAEIDYICAHVRDLLGKSLGKTSMKPSGVLGRRDHVENWIADVKKSERAAVNTIHKDDFSLVPVTGKTINNKEEVKLLADWRAKIQIWFPTQFKVTEEGTKRWVENGVINLKDRVLYFIEDNENKKIGHVGLYRFNYAQNYCELDNIVRGVDDLHPGVMAKACGCLLDLCFGQLNQENVYLRVFADNERALKLYRSLGFEEIQRVPLFKVEADGITSWLETIGQPYNKTSRYFVTMRIDKGTWTKKK